MRNGVWLREWCDDCGAHRQYVVVRDGRVLRLKAGRWRDGRWWESMDGSWTWVRDLDERLEPPKAL